MPGQLGAMLPSAEQVYMDMVDQLATATAYVHSETIPLRDNVPLRCQVFHDHEQLAHEGDVLLLQVVDRGNVQLWDHQDMNGRLRVDVFKGHDLVVFMHNTGWGTPGDDLTENTRHGLR